MVLALSPWESLPKRTISSEKDDCYSFLEQVLQDIQLEIHDKESDDIYDIFDVLQHHLLVNDAKLQQNVLEKQLRSGKTEIANFLVEHISRNEDLYHHDFQTLSEPNFQNQINKLVVPTSDLPLLLQIIANSIGTVLIVVSSAKDKLFQTITPQVPIQATEPFFFAYMHAGSARFVCTVPIVQGEF